MKQLLENSKKKDRIEKALDVFPLEAVLQYMAYRFLQNTVFIVHYSQTCKLITMSLLLFFGGIHNSR